MEKINKLKKLIKDQNLDGYIIPKNDEFFGEYIPEYKDRLKYISNFSGSYGFALILKNNNYLFVDGRYSLQAKHQSGKFFIIKTIPNELPENIQKNKKLIIGFDSKLFTKKFVQFFLRNTKNKYIPVNRNLIDKIWIRKKNPVRKKFYILPNYSVGENYKSKIKKIIFEMKKKKQISNLLLLVKIMHGCLI